MNQLNEGKTYDVPEFGHFSVKGKKLKLEFYNLEDWDSSLYYGPNAKGHKQAMKDIKLCTTGNNDPLLDDIEMHLSNSGLGEINWDKPMKLTDGGSSIEFMLESLSVNEAAVPHIKEFGDLVALLGDSDQVDYIHNNMLTLDPKQARTLEKKISAVYKALFKLA